jgi:hypothetical protein
MPTLGNALDFAKYEGRQFRAHQLGAAPSTPVTGQLYYNTADNTLYWWDGTAWQSAKAPSSMAPTGPAGGDLSGTYPNPGIAAGVIVDADVNAAAAIQPSKLSPNPTTRASHTGTQLAATISDFNTARDLQRLDQHVAPTAPVALGGQKITGLADPAAGTDGANKQYVDNAIQGLDALASVKAASTANLALSAAQTVDGVALVANDRVLVKNQTLPQENGVYLVAAGAWTRAPDNDTWAEVPSAYVWVEQGTVNADTGWVSTADAGGTLGTTPMPWVQFSSAGAAIAGAGLTKTGSTLDVGQGTGITVAADTVGLTIPVALTSGGTGQTTAKASRETGLGAAGYYSSATHGAGTTISITAATHGLRASRGLLVQVQDEATGAVELPDIVVAANGDVTVTYGAALTANTKRVTVIG